MTSEPLIMTRSRLHVWFSTQLWKLRWRFATHFFGRQGDGKEMRKGSGERRREGDKLSSTREWGTFCLSRGS
uniref:Uncharacterized protein n=1 Tax=Macaca nemestrina TaxID=9545 RepID=A0A2K6CG59_MACNE